MTAALIRICTLLLTWMVTGPTILGQCSGNIINQDEKVTSSSTTQVAEIDHEDYLKRLSPFGFYENWDRIPNALTGDDHFVSDPLKEQEEEKMSEFITVQWELKKEELTPQSDDQILFELPELKKILLHYSDKDKPLKVDIKTKKRTKRIEAPTKNLTSISLVDVNNTWFMVAISKANTSRVKNQLQVLVILDQKLIRTAYAMLNMVPRTSSQAAAYLAKHGTRLEKVDHKKKPAEVRKFQDMDRTEDEESLRSRKSRANAVQMDNPLMAKVKLPRHPRRTLPIISDSQTAVQHQRDREGLWMCNDGTPHNTNTTTSRAGSLRDSSEWQGNGTLIFSNSPPRYHNGGLQLLDQQHIADRSKLTTSEQILLQQRALEHQYSQSTAGYSTPTRAIVTDGNSLPVTPERGVNPIRHRHKFNTPTTIVCGTPESLSEMSAYSAYKRLTRDQHQQDEFRTDRMSHLFNYYSEDMEDEKDDVDSQQSKRHAASSYTSTFCGFPISDQMASSYTTSEDETLFKDSMKKPIRRIGSWKHRTWIGGQLHTTEGSGKVAVTTKDSAFKKKTAYMPTTMKGNALLKRNSQHISSDCRSILMDSDSSSQIDGMKQDNHDDCDHVRGSEFDDQQRDSAHIMLGDLTMAQWKQWNIQQRRKVAAQSKLIRMEAMCRCQDVDLGQKQHQESSGKLQFDFEEEFHHEKDLWERDEHSIDFLRELSKGQSAAWYMDLQGHTHPFVDTSDLKTMELRRNSSTPFLLQDLYNDTDSSTRMDEQARSPTTLGSTGMLSLLRQRSNTDNSTRSSSTPFPMLKMIRQSSAPLNYSPYSMDHSGFPLDQEEQMRSLATHGNVSIPLTEIPRGSPRLMCQSATSRMQNVSSTIIMQSDSGQHLKLSGSSPTPPPPPQVKCKPKTLFFRHRKTWIGNCSSMQSL